MIRSIAFLRKRVVTSFGLNEYPHFCNMGINAAQVVLDLMAVSLAIELRKEGGGSQTVVELAIYFIHIRRIEASNKYLIGLISFGI